MAVKIKDIAKMAGVSEATVSLALGGSPLVSDKTRRRVEKIAQEAGYAPNPYAKKLALRKSGMLGLVIPDIENVYYAALVHYINRAVRKTGYGLAIAISENEPALEANVLREMAENRVEGLLFVPVNVPGGVKKPLEYFEKAGIPALFVSTSVPGAQSPCVMCDLEGGMRALTEHLRARGVRYAALVTGPAGVYALDLREQGFTGVMENQEVLHRSAVTYEEGEAAARELFARDRLPEAVLCVNDTMALGLLNELLRRGVRVPEDTAVCGFDDVVFSRASEIPLTTVRQDVKTMAERAVEMLLQRIGQRDAKWESVLIPTELVIRPSVKQ